jgi:hypothetical protein
MTAALTPELALRYLAELDPAIEAIAVVGEDGTVLAGDPSLAVGAGGCVTARSARHLLIARVPPGALDGLVRHDLEVVVRELSPAPLPAQRP